MSSFTYSYNGCLEIMLNLISEKPERYMIIVATHNEESVRRAVTRYTFINRSFHWQVIISIVTKISVYLPVVSVFQDGRVGASQRGKLCLFWSAAGHVWPCLSYSGWVSFYSVALNEFISFTFIFSSQPSMVSQSTSQCRTAQWRTHCHIWCEGLRRTALCSRESVRREIYSDRSSAADSKKRSQGPDRKTSEEREREREERKIRVKGKWQKTFNTS